MVNRLVGTRWIHYVESVESARLNIDVDGVLRTQALLLVVASFDVVTRRSTLRLRPQSLTSPEIQIWERTQNMAKQTITNTIMID